MKKLHLAFHEKGSFACYIGHGIRFATVMLQGCLSYTPIVGQSVNTNNSHKALCDLAPFSCSRGHVIRSITVTGQIHSK